MENNRALQGPDTPQRHWMSYEYSMDDSVFTESGAECVISVMMGGSSNDSFSGIHLRIICQDLEGFEELRIRECFDPVQLGIADRGTAHYGGQLRIAKEVTEREKACQRRFGKPHLPSLPLVFELVSSQNAPLRYKLELRSSSGNDIDSRLQNLRVVFEKYLPLWSGCGSKFVYLDFGPDYPFIVPITCRCCEPLSLPRHCLRVHPIGGVARPSISLPKRIIKSIVSQAVDPYRTLHWRRELLNYALVQKSWVDASDVFFETYLTYQINVTGNPIPVARSLKLRPERGCLISVFDDNLLTFEQRTRGLKSEELLDAAQVIMEAGLSSIKTLKLHKALFHRTQQLLARFENVQTFTIVPIPHWESDEHVETGYVHRFEQPDVLTMGDIQQVIKSWAKVRKLVLNRWDPPSRHVSEIALSSPPLPILEELSLNNGILLGHELAFFTNARLYNLSLSGIIGLKNSDLLTTLLSLRYTLMSFSLLECELSQEEDEPLAIESALPHMTAIWGISISGEQPVSCAIISGKRENPLCDPLPRSDTDSSLARLELYQAPVDLLPMLTEALEKTHWNDINIYFRNEKVVDQEALESAKKVAWRRGIQLSLFCSEPDDTYMA